MVCHLIFILQFVFLIVDFFLVGVDPIRTSRTTQSREKCLKILLTILDESLDYELDQWSSSSINLTKLNQNQTHELIKLVNGLIKLSIKCNNPSIGLIEPSIQSDHQITFDNSISTELNPIKYKPNKTSLPTSTATLTTQLASSLSSNASSYSTFKPTRMNFKSNFSSPIASPLSQSSPNHQRAGSSTTSTLRRSLN
ncbi:uncharacterized protein MELLADRAFT_56405 [Melampsora larici-populina 98AG31]|uniref:Uncharacterized protein n=1 Tax=Melampsora larici-populina (strain 98AG31 / pathotype 3-4-7) TaxID=747676 RepID=F4RQ78_MELLP|nr:uncharacterized protein MELLADRAFT_56405 [Melampsora larici-populina 98AG31]EGG05356.1 hypothetical protein MELLADRAFT_56405 [Melampsora larici-populina 98AG31]